MKMTRRNGSGFVTVVDVLNMIFGIIIIVCAVFLLVDMREYARMFFVVFAAGTAMNINMAIKYYNRNDMARMIALAVFALILIALAVFSLVTVWF